MCSEVKKQNLHWVCPRHRQSLIRRNQIFHCKEGCSFPLVNDILRFVPPRNYASSFGLQWNEYRTAQLDSHTGLSVSRDRLKRLMGGSFDILKGKKLLEAGCGAGRFTEILLEADAHVWAIDISTAVEANYRNCSKYDHYGTAQASILELPFEEGQFDIVLCIGVIQHTPDPEQTMTALCAQLKPGGRLLIDHYTYGYPTTLSRKYLRTFLAFMPNTFSLRFCKLMTFFLWPVHRWLWIGRNVPLVKQMRAIILRISPLVDYHDAYPQLGPPLLKMWAALDTHDTLTDRYKHLRSAQEIESHLRKCSMINIETSYAGNGVEARAQKP